MRHTMLLSLACIALSAGLLVAQTFFGSIVGTITDSSGASVVSAKVALTSTATGERRATTSGADGNYQFVNLIPGVYRVDVENAGFKHLTRDSIEIQVQATVRVDGVMQLGDVGQTVEVGAQIPLLQTETYALGTVVDQRKVQEMPLNGRNVLNLVTLVPGVVAQGSALANPTGLNINSFGNYQINGAIAGQNATFLDGVTLNVKTNFVAILPTQDAISEFKVQTNGVGPEFGRIAGGVINLTSKSGTNQFHGSGYEFLRNKVLNANNFFNNSSGAPRPAFTQNQYGANIGGPVKKDKTFFFFSWEGFRLRQGQPFLLPVPTAQQRAGDFSNTRTANGALTTIFDPATTNCSSAATCGTSGPVRLPIPNNIIPPNRLDPAAKILSTYWGQPNTPGLPFTNLKNYSNNASVGGGNDEYNLRIDHNLGEAHRLFFRATYFTDRNLPIEPYSNSLCQDRCLELWGGMNAVLGDTWLLSPTTVVDLRLSALRQFYDRTPATLGVDLTKFGLPASLNSQIAYPVIPTVVVQNFSDVWTSQGSGSFLHQRNDNFSLYPSVTKMAGHHTVKFGGEVRRQINNNVQDNIGGGLYNFDNLFTSQNPYISGGGGTGVGLASYMLGLGSSGSIITASPWSYRNYYSGLYVNDTWQVSQKLTLNYGIRWELPFGQVERYDRLANFLPNAASPIAQAAGIPNLLGRLGLVKSADNPDRTAQAAHFRLFAPRLGLAYRVDNKTAIRSGYGIFYVQNIPDGAGGAQLTLLTQSWVPTVDGSLTSVATLSNPFPGGLVQPPQRNPNFQTLLLGTSLTEPIVGAANQHLGYVQQWNFSVGRELMNGLVLDVAYAGSKGTHLDGGGPVLNQLPVQSQSLGTSVLQSQVKNPFYGLAPFGTLAQPTVAYGQLLRPYPQYTGVTGVNDGNRDSVYHSLQVKVEKRFHQGGSVLAAYTWSKNIGDIETQVGYLEAGPIAGIQNNYNLRGERAISGFDVPHRLIVSYVYDLPFGKGRQFLANSNRVVNGVFGGWGINGISTFQQGFPLTFTTSSNSTNAFGGGSRPNYVGGCDPVIGGSAQSRLNGWFNKTCFVAPPASTFGNLGRTFTGVRTAGIANFDFSMFKSIDLTERFKLQFRTEFFNIFNRVQFGVPGESQGTAAFGVVSSQLNTPRLVQFALRLNY